MKRLVALAFSHTIVLAIGFALGIYLLPILVAPPSPEAAVLRSEAQAARYSATLSRDLDGSDALHWGEGTISINSTRVVHQGKLAPGPDYKVYLAPEFVENEAEFERIKADSALIGGVKTFDGFLLDMPAEVDIEDYSTVVIWCETFGEFITAAQYK